MAPIGLFADVGDVLPVIFVLIAIASGIVNFFKERRAADQLKPRMRNDADAVDSELQSEIDAFLEEVSTGKADSPRPARPAQVEQRRRQARSSQEEERRRRIRARRERERREREAAKARESLESRHLEASDIGKVSQRHVPSAVEDRHLESVIAIESTQESAAESAVSEPAARAAAAQIPALLQQPGGIRNAIVLNEILSPPVSRRPRTRR